uniref:30S ribosomal protein S6, chloroplastic n=1 Tax=Sebdenia flabellata TaxID=42024 RepID=A0A1C9CA20_9FLOR|nr:ribosomal protein S6 [Sebdenia flabellata]AOM65226.1 ribosomal protein S6 [Sebdenia flabellata]
MILNSYETIYILKPDVTEETNLNLVNEYKSIIRKNGGQNIFIQHKGRRHLSYNITNYYDGIYVQMNYEGSRDLVKKIEKCMSFNDNIIRYLTVKQNIIASMKL